AERAAFDLDVEGAVLIAFHEEVLQPATFAADGARAFLQPILGVAAERLIKGRVLPFNAAVVIDDGDRYREFLCASVVAHCGMVSVYPERSEGSLVVQPFRRHMRSLTATP